MISVEEALDKVLSCVSVLEKEEKPLLEGLGQVLAEDIYSQIDIPSWDTAAMDGFAVQAESTQGASPGTPRVLHLIGEAAAGYPFPGKVVPGTAVRIMTGAPLPRGADSVVPFEDTDEREPVSSKIGILREITPGTAVRRSGEDLTAGSLVLAKGTPLHPVAIEILASLGIAAVAVIRRPVVGILATGDELLEPGQPLEPGKIYASNLYALAAQVSRSGGIPRILGIAPDNREVLREKLLSATDTDLLLTTGGMSRGDYDLVKEILIREGELVFQGVRMKPGKDLALGMLRGERGGKAVPHLGLPGNPPGAMVCFELFARPAIGKMKGRRDLSPPVIRAIMENHLYTREGYRRFIPVAVNQHQGQYFARLIRGRRSSEPSAALTHYNGLAILPEGKGEVREGDEVEVLMLHRAEEGEEVNSWIF